MNNQYNTFLMNQFANAAVPMQTPLHHALQAGVGADAMQNGVGGIVLTERCVTGHLVIRLKGDLLAASSMMLSVCGVPLPYRLSYLGMPLDATLNTLAWMSPDEWRLCCPVDRAFDLEQRLLAELSALPGLSPAIVNNTGGFTIIDLSGKDAKNLLKKSTGYDVREQNFPVGKVVNTTFAKASVTLLRTGEEQWQLWLRRSFAEYVWLWLQHSAKEYGLRII